MNKENTTVEIAKHNPEAFKELYIKYHNQIFRFIFNKVRDEHQTADITSQVFLKAMLNIKKYNVRGLPFSSWLYRIARNECMDHFRKSKKEMHISTSIDLVTDLVIEMSHELTTPIEPQDIGKAFGMLSMEEVQLVEMRFFEQLRFHQIAEQLGITENNAKVRLYRSLDKMKKALI